MFWHEDLGSIWHSLVELDHETTGTRQMEFCFHISMPLFKCSRILRLPYFKVYVFLQKLTRQEKISCPKIFRNCPKLQSNSDINFEDVFKNVEVQLRATHVIMAVFETKVKLET